MFSFCALHHSAMSVFILRHRKIASSNCIPRNSIGNISICSNVLVTECDISCLVSLCSELFNVLWPQYTVFSNGWLFGTFYRKPILQLKGHNSCFLLKLSEVNCTKRNIFLSENVILSWLGFVLEASILRFCLKIVGNDIIVDKGPIMEFQ